MVGECRWHPDYHAPDVRHRLPCGPLSGPALRVAVLGAGTVGAEVVRAFRERPERLESGGTRLELAGVAVRALGQRRPGHLPDDILTDAPAHLVASPDVDVVCELMGGDEPARTLIAAALGAGKAVVTANKHVLAHHGSDLETIARGTRAPLRFEAAVAGGIPVVGPLANELAANRIARVRGIVNGTTNAILSAMEEPGTTYHKALRAAQQAGYAEADPRGDVEGDDPANKLVVLTRLAFGRWLPPGSIARRVPTVRGAASPGITAVDANEVTGALALGYTIRLLAAAAAPVEQGADPHAWVLPTAVSATGGFGRTRGVLNHVEVESDLVGRLGFSGPGAGGSATASAVLGDLLAIAAGGGSSWGGLPAAGVTGPGRVPDVASAEDAARSGWFAFLPSVPPSALTTDLCVQATSVAGGSAIRLRPVPLDEIRAVLRPLIAAGTDPALYPLDV
jgi:homoserine dehydrogenase